MPACIVSSAPAQHSDCTNMQRHSCIVVPRCIPACRRPRRFSSSPWSGGRPRTDLSYDHFITLFLCCGKTFRPLAVPRRVDPGTAKRPGSKVGARRSAGGGSYRKGMPDLRLTVGGDPADNIHACVCSTHASTASREETHTHVCKLRMPAQLQEDNTHASVQSTHASAAAGYAHWPVCRVRTLARVYTALRCS